MDEWMEERKDGCPPPPTPPTSSPPTSYFQAEKRAVEMEKKLELMERDVKQKQKQVLGERAA
jgi:hypothetical protein